MEIQKPYWLDKIVWCNNCDIRFKLGQEDDDKVQYVNLITSPALFKLDFGHLPRNRIAGK